MQINTINRNDLNYPKKLAELSYLNKLYYAGNISIIDKNKIVAIIGKRETTPRKLDIAKKVGAFACHKGYAVLNGLAIGCDTSAILGTLSEGAKVIAVMPCALDNIYPKCNRKLANKIIETGGCLISEYPSGSVLQKQNFVKRDKIQADLADIVCVIAADEKGGTMHTVNFALIANKKIICFYDSMEEQSSGNELLIKTERATSFTTWSELNSALS